MKNRIHWLDVLRGLAIFFVVIGHTVYRSNLEIYLYSFHIPLFFFISGITFKYINDYKEFFVKKVKSLLVPYFCFGLISIVVFMLLGKVAAAAFAKNGLSYGFKENFLGLLYGSAKTGNLKFNYPLWFLPCLFMTTNLFYFICKLFNNKQNWLVYSPFVFGLLTYLINYKTSITTLIFGLETSISMLVFFSLGYSFRNSPFFNKEYDRKLLFVFSVVLLIVGGYIGFKNGRVACSVDKYNNLGLFYLGSLSSIAGYVCLAKTVNHNAVLEYLGKNSLTILLLHKFPVLFFQVVVGFTAAYLNKNNLVMVFICGSLSIVMCLIANLVIERYLPFLLGRSYQKGK